MPEMDKKKVRTFQKSFVGQGRDQKDDGILSKVKRLLGAAQEDVIESGENMEGRKEKTRQLLEKLRAKSPSIQPAPLEEDEEELRRQLEEEAAAQGRRSGP
jgi:hypothetical protein